MYSITTGKWLKMNRMFDVDLAVWVLVFSSDSVVGKQSVHLGSFFATVVRENSCVQEFH